jgi:hypothetical protein
LLEITFQLVFLHLVLQGFILPKWYHLTDKYSYCPYNKFY